MTAPAPRFLVRAELGRGATGTVSLADDALTGRRVALKRLTAADEASRVLFRLEYHAMKRLALPGLVAAYDLGQDEAGDWLTMEVIDGAAWPAGPVDAGEAARLLAEVARTLAALHAKGLVHGDLKAENLRFDASSGLRLLDLGFLEQAGRPGRRRGTPEAMAPEVIRGEPTDPRSDLYAWGVLGYALLAGRPPFSGTDPLAVLQAQLHEAPPALAAPAEGLGRAVADAVMACLAKDPAARPASAAALLRRLGVPAAEAGGLLFGSDMFGRDPLLAAARAHVAAQGRGEEGALALHGPAGVGRTRLLAALVAATPERVAVRVEGRGDVPHRLLADLIAAIEGPMLDAGLAPGDPAWQALRAVVPAWGEPPAALEPRAQEGRLRQALAALLGALGAARPVLVAIDDWARADEASRALLAPLLASTAAPGVAWVVTAEAAPSAVAVALAVPPLAPEAMAAIVATALGGASEDGPGAPGGGVVPGVAAAEAGPDAALVDQVLARAQGRPAVVRDLLQHWLRTGALAWADGRWRFDGARGGEPPATPLDGVTPPALALARAAAVLGPAGELAALASLAEGDPFGPLAELEAAGVLARQGDRYQFLGLAHDAALAGLPADEARALHARAAARLEGATDVGGMSEAARHLLAAGAPDAARVVLAAVRANVAQGVLGTAASLLAGLPAGATVQPAGDGASAGATVSLTGGGASAGAGAAGRSAGSAPGLSPAEAQEAERLRGDLARMRGDGAGAIAHYERAIAAARALGDQAALCRELVGAGRAALVVARGDDARAWSAEAITLAQAAHAPAQEARALMTLGRLKFFGGDVPGARADYARAIAVAEAAGERALLADALSFMAAMAPPADPEAAALLERGRAIHRELQNPLGFIDASINLADRRLAAGDPAGAEGPLAEALTTCRQVGARQEEAFVRLNLAQAKLERGLPAEAAAEAAAAHAAATDVGAAFPAGYAQAFAAAALQRLGRYGDARAALAEGARLAAETGIPYLDVAVKLAAAELAVHLGAPEAEAAVAAARAAAGGDAGAAVRADLAAARLLSLVGRLGEAEAAFAAARAAAEAHGGRMLAVRALLGAADAARRQGAFDRACAAAEAALAEAEALGAGELALEARWQLGEAARLAGHPAAATGHFLAAEAAARAVGDALWAALAAVGAGKVALGQAAGEARARGEAGLRALAAEAGPGFETWPERRPEAGVAVDGGAAPTAGGLAEALGMLADMRGASSLEALLKRVLDRLIGLTGAAGGAIMAYAEDQADAFAVAAMTEQQLLGEPLIDQAVWDSAIASDGPRWAMPVRAGGELAAVVFLDGARADRLALVPGLEEAIAHVLGHFRELQAIGRELERLRFGEDLAALALAGGDAGLTFREALVRVLRATRGERAFLLRAAEPDFPPIAAVDAAGRPLPPDAPISRSTCRHVVETGKGLRLVDPQQAAGWQQQQSILALGLQAIVVVPVRAGVGVPALLYVDSGSLEALPGPREQGLLETAAALLAPLVARA